MRFAQQEDDRQIPKMCNAVRILAALAFLVLGVSAKANKVVCYYGSWAVYRPGNGKYAVEDLDVSKCTHAIYAFVGINNDASIHILDQWNDIDLKAFKRFASLKQRRPELKLLVAIGGWNEGSSKFSHVAKSADLRKKFAKNALAFIRKYSFDGFDLDWEYPAQRGGDKADKANVVKLLNELRKAFGKKYLLTAAVGASASAIKQSYDVSKFVKPLDFVNLMTYDIHGPFDGKTGHNSPLSSVDASVKAWISNGAPPNKLILGMPLYGHSFTVSDSSKHGINNPASNGDAGEFTGQEGLLGYNEICLRIKKGWSVKWDSKEQVPYMWKGNQWVSFDNEKSIAAKAKYVKSMQLGGAMVWSIDTDDFHGICGKKHGLLAAINKEFFG